MVRVWEKGSVSGKNDIILGENDARNRGYDVGSGLFEVVLMFLL